MLKMKGKFKFNEFKDYLVKNCHTHHRRHYHHRYNDRELNTPIIKINVYSCRHFREQYCRL